MEEQPLELPEQKVRHSTNAAIWNDPSSWHGSEDEDEHDNESNDDEDTKTIVSYIPPYLQSYVFPCLLSGDTDSDFCYTPYGVGNPRLIAQLMMEGFLPMAHSNTLFLPKLHRQRCLIHPLQQLHISKNSRKKAKHYDLTMNQAFDDVVAECHAQHAASCWLYPALVQVFRDLLQTTVQHPDDGTVAVDVDNGTRYPVAVRFYSAEVWRRNDDHGTRHLVAGEIGYTVGDCGVYTSLTGFSNEDSAGSVQLASLGALLLHWGFACWDLGMHMPYKEQLGGRTVPRDQFIALLQQWRRRRSSVPTTRHVDDVMEEETIVTGATSNAWLPEWPISEIAAPLSCREVIDAVLPRAVVTPSPKKPKTP